VPTTSIVGGHAAPGGPSNGHSCRRCDLALRPLPRHPLRARPSSLTILSIDAAHPTALRATTGSS